MFDNKFVREHEDEIRETLKRQKRDDKVVDDLLEKDDEWRSLKGEVDKLRARRNKVSESINKAKKAGDDADDLIREAKEIPPKLKEVERRMSSLYEDTLKPILAQIPNIMHPDVPYGKDDSKNPEVKSWGETKKPSFEVKNHVELLEKRGLADFEASATTSGNGFYFLKGELGLLNQALIRYATDTLTKKGYEYVEPPLMIRRHVLEAAMDAEGFKETIYGVQDEDLCLIGTSEHAILGMHEGETFQEDDLPKKYVGYSMCFRQEIGSHGINEKGLWRTHQFNKVEQFIFSLPEQSWDLYDELLANGEAILQALKLPYRVVEICTGDLAPWKARSHDLEVWRPTTKEYGEVASLSNCTSYQANDLTIRYKKRDGERGVVHTLNNTALATSRILVSIIEHYQNKDGTITVPEVLQPYMGGKKSI